VAMEKKLKGEFPSDCVYLDAAGAALPMKKAVLASAAELVSKAVANPHTSAEARQRVSDARKLVLAHFGAREDEYAVIFTSGATAAARMVGEAMFKTANNGSFVYSTDSHTSLVGLRALAAKSGAEVRLMDDALQRGQRGEPNLATFPGQSNFTGHKYAQETVPRLQRAGYRVLLDAAALAATNDVKLAGDFKPDFLCISFYKVS